MAGVCTFICGVLCLVFWTFAKTYASLIAFALIVGCVSGTFWATVAPVGAEVVGIQTLPSALALLWIFLVLPSTFSEPIALKLRRSTGNQFLHAQLFTGFMYIAAALCAWFLRAWKIREEQRLQEELQRKKEEAGAGAGLHGGDGGPPILRRHASRVYNMNHEFQKSRCVCQPTTSALEKNLQTPSVNLFFPRFTSYTGFGVKNALWVIFVLDSWLTSASLGREKCLRTNMSDGFD
ncbi:putative transporter MCH2 [Glarea lozoyensis 74030]|uniref:Putative transporter MCH2 n=1 Tax=Glarea lozoyensis (strain ATCC 74030 / MF5533) TaxID=1104152 RepID=H0EL55_GLAL7|nr:putative transporter MCH2 [Glarea lozoyensis 74030]